MKTVRNSMIGSLTRRAGAAAAMLAAAGLAATAAWGAAPATTRDPHGVWLRPEGGVQFSFYDCGALLCAKVIGAKSEEDRSAIGTVILRGAAKTGPNEWKGKLYNSEDGKTYDGVITVTSASELELKGCLWGVLCSGETWKRVSGPPAAAATPAAPKASAATVPAAPVKPSTNAAAPAAPAKPSTTAAAPASPRPQTTTAAALSRPQTAGLALRAQTHAMAEQPK